jgi:hypothetical protein
LANWKKKYRNINIVITLPDPGELAGYDPEQMIQIRQYLRQIVILQLEVNDLKLILRQLRENGGSQIN